MNKQPYRLLIIVLLLGWAFDFLFWKKSAGVNFSIFTGLCLLGGLSWLLLGKLRPAAGSLWLFLPIPFFAVMTFVRQEPLTVFLAYTFTIISLGLLTVTYLGGRWMHYGLADLFKKSVLLIGSMIARVPGYIRQNRIEQAEDSRLGRKKIPVQAIIRGLLIALPIVACFTSLLASGDAVFNQKIMDFFEEFTIKEIFEDIFRLILILICAYLLAGAFLHAATQSQDEKLPGEEKPTLKPFLGFTEAAIVMGSVTVLFLMFVIIQFQYFFGGQTNIGVEGYTYSQYARRGFNELVMVAFFSLIMILGLSTITKRHEEYQKRVFSGLSVAIATLVIVILVSAYQRITMAILWHGFSRLRLYPRVFLIWVGILFIAVVVLELLRRERYFASAALLATIGFAATLPLVNVDAAIVHRNIYRSAHGWHLNVPHLASLSEDAIPALVQEFNEPFLPVYTHEGIGAILSCYSVSRPESPEDAQDWQSFNLSRWQADMALEGVAPDLKTYNINTKKWPVRVRTPNGFYHQCQDNSSNRYFQDWMD